jgi:F-type H+-transporting ATPase subunit epsilon
MTTFHLVVASVGETKFDGDADSATFPGSDGEFTVLANHEPFVSTLKEGSIHVKNSSGTVETFDISTGVVEVSNNRAIVLI